MSAENGLQVFRMDDGEYWIFVVRCGSTDDASQGEHFGEHGAPLARCTRETFTTAINRLLCERIWPDGRPLHYSEEQAFLDENRARIKQGLAVEEPGWQPNPDYTWTEHGLQFSGIEQVDARPVSYVGGIVRVVDRSGFFDPYGSTWVVEEVDARGENLRILHEGVDFFVAIALADEYQMCQPAVAQVHVPTFREADPMWTPDLSTPTSPYETSLLWIEFEGEQDEYMGVPPPLRENAQERRWAIMEADTRSADRRALVEKVTYFEAMRCASVICAQRGISDLRIVRFYEANPRFSPSNEMRYEDPFVSVTDAYHLARERRG